MTFWYDKYRPKSLDEYVWTNDITEENIRKWVSNPLENPHLILHGPTGTGKTTLALLIKETLGDSIEYKFMPASLQSGVDDIRDQIVGFCDSAGFADMKIIIMDEADNLSLQAQKVLRNVMDRYNKDVRFIFTCNYPEKIIDALMGRSWGIPISKLSDDAFLERLLEILDAENIDIENDENIDVLETVVSDNYPNMRKAISELQWRSNGNKLTTLCENVSNDVISQVVDQLAAFDITTIREYVTSLSSQQYLDIYKYLYENSQMFETKEKDAIIIICDYLSRHETSYFQDITLCACLIKLETLIG